MSLSSADHSAPFLSIVSGDPTPEELAAATAVIAAMLEELELGADAAARPKVSAWQRSQRAVRSPLAPGYGAWRGFAG